MDYCKLSLAAPMIYMTTGLQALARYLAVLLSARRSRLQSSS